MAVDRVQQDCCHPCGRCG